MSARVKSRYRDPREEIPRARDGDAFLDAAFAADEADENAPFRFRGVCVFSPTLPAPLLEALGEMMRFTLPVIFEGALMDDGQNYNASDFTELASLLGRTPTLIEAETWLSIQRAEREAAFAPLMAWAEQCGTDLARYHAGLGALAEISS